MIAKGVAASSGKPQPSPSVQATTAVEEDGDGEDDEAVEMQEACRPKKKTLKPFSV